MQQLKLNLIEMRIDTRWSTRLDNVEKIHLSATWYNSRKQEQTAKLSQVEDLKKIFLFV